MKPEDIKVFDADGHITEPPDLWENYIEPRFRDTCPKVFTGNDRTETFRIDDKLTWSTVRQPLKSSIATSTGWGLRDGVVDWDRAYVDGEQGGFDPHKRIAWMDSEGFDASVLFPTMAISAIWETYEADRMAAITDAYNRYVLDFRAPYPDRLFPATCLPMLSVEESVKQLKWTAEHGLRLACVRPNPVGGKALHHPDFYPVWREAQELGVGIAVHGTAGPHNLGMDRFASKDLAKNDDGVRERHHKGSYAMEHCFTHAAEMMAAVTSFVLGGVCDKHPRLRVGFIEAGGSWVPGYVDRMERHFTDRGMNDTGLSTSPIEIFKRQCFTGFEPVESSIVDLAGRFGANKLMSSDYPHSDGFPHSLKMIEKMDLPAQMKTDLCSAGAKEWLGLA